MPRYSDYFQDLGRRTILIIISETEGDLIGFGKPERIANFEENTPVCP